MSDKKRHTHKKRALIVCTVAGFLGFLLDNIETLVSLDYDVCVATNFYKNAEIDWHEKLEEVGVPRSRQMQVDFTRSPFTPDVVKAYEELRDIVFRYKFNLIHCHTPVGGVLARLAAKSYNDAIEQRRRAGKKAPEKAKVIYTAHGFHFYDGAPIRYWLTFYPIEKMLSRYTDVLITINREDYNRAKKEFYAKKTVYIPGVGVDTKKFASVAGSIDREKKREELGVKPGEIMLLSVGELNGNKNHRVVMEALSRMPEKKIAYFIAGTGDKKDELEQLAEREDVDLHLLGFRNDVSELLAAADLYILPSIREGLNVSLMEAMASGTPCLCGRIRGNVDLVDEGKGGEMFVPEDVGSVEEAIRREMEDDWEEQGRYNRGKIGEFDLRVVDDGYGQVIRELQTD